MNNNQVLIDSLREFATFLEMNPGVPNLNEAMFGPESWPLRLHVMPGSKDGLKQIGRALGSLRKQFDDYHFTLVKSFGAGLELHVSISREAICKKIVKWECPDDEALLKEFETAEAQ